MCGGFGPVTRGELGDEDIAEEIGIVANAAEPAGSMAKTVRIVRIETSCFERGGAFLQ